MHRILRGRISGRMAGMRSPAAFALAVALALPGLAQHQAGHGGSSSPRSGGTGHGGGAVHTGLGGGSGYSGPRYSVHAPSYSGLAGLQQPSSFSAPGRFPMQAPFSPRRELAYRFLTEDAIFQAEAILIGLDTPAGIPTADPTAGTIMIGVTRNRGSYGYLPGYVYSYPYVVDPGFYDWGATDYSENEQGANAPPDQGSDDGYGPEPPPYPGYGNAS